MAFSPKIVFSIFEENKITFLEKEFAKIAEGFEFE
jgi:hypothetical protein